MHLVVLGSMDPMAEDFWSGIPTNIVIALRDAGHTVTTIGPLPPRTSLWARLKGRFHRHVFGKTYAINRDPAIFRRRARLANELLDRQAAIDAVIVVYPPDAAYLRSRVPLILVHDATWHQLIDFYPGYERGRIAGETLRGGDLLDRRALENCDWIIYASAWAAEDAARYYGADRRKLRVQPLGANLRSIPEAGDVERWRRQRGRNVCRLLFVGIDWYRKGGDIAIGIAQALQDRGLAVELNVVGPPPHADAPGFVHFFGFLSWRNPNEALTMTRLFAEADFFVLPSRAECFGMVLCEAAAYGLPVVTTAVGGIPEIVGSGDWGIALPPATPPSEYARWIATAFSDRTRYERLSKAAREEFTARLSWGSFCRALTGLVREADLVREAGPAATATTSPAGAPRAPG